MQRGGNFCVIFIPSKFGKDGLQAVLPAISHQPFDHRKFYIPTNRVYFYCDTHYSFINCFEYGGYG